MVRKVGRPAVVDADRIAQAGMVLTLPRLSIKGVAAQLGVSEMTVYRHVGNLEGLRRVVAGGVYRRLELGAPQGKDARAELVEHATTVRDFVVANPGSAPYLAEPPIAHAEVLERLSRHHEAWAAAFGWEPAEATVVLSTVTSHALALVHLFPHDFPHDDEPSVPSTETRLPETILQGLDLSLEHGDVFTWSMGVLADGLLAWLAERRHT